MRLVLVFGTRPQIIKSVPVICELLRRGLDMDIIHTGQHYDKLMSDIFFKIFSIPYPKANLGVGSGSQGYQVGEIIIKLEKALLESEPDAVIVPGDTNSALASAIITAKLRIPLIHIEAGARCYDMSMQEEINRRIIDHISSMLFCVSKNCVNNLRQENVPGKIIFSGDTMYEVYKMSSKNIVESNIIERLNLEPKEYAVLTLHREENVENVDRLFKVLVAVKSIGTKVVFPIHPRTRKKLLESKLSIKCGRIVIVDPLDYFSMMRLIRDSILVLTDSGGLQKEAFWSKVPCVTLRDRTEWVETIQAGVNFLAGTNPNRIIETCRYIMYNYEAITSKFKLVNNPYLNKELSKAPSKIIIDEILKFIA